MKRVLDDLQIFCVVVQSGSLKKASEKLAIPHSTVSRRIEALEKQLGLTLLHRTTRAVKVSSRGQLLYEDCVQMLDSISQSIETAIDDEIQFKGRLNISMPVRAGLDFLGGWLIDFAAEHPDLKLDLSLSNSNKHLIKDNIDLAFRVGPLVDSSAIALHLWDIPYAICCHKSFAERHCVTQAGVNVTALESLPCVISRPASKWAFLDKDKNEHILTPNAELTVDDLGLACHAVSSGQYLAMLPTSMIEDDDIIELPINGLQPRTRIMYAYYLGRRHAQSQIKHLVGYIKARYAQQKL